MARVGTAEVGAIALADTAIMEILIVPVYGLVEAMQIVVSRRAGEGRDRSIGAIFNRTLAITVPVSLVLALALGIFASPLSEALVTSPAVAAELADFLAIAPYGIVFMAVSLSLSSLYVGLGQARVLVWATLVLVAANLLLSWAFIFGELGAPRLEMRGAAVGFVGAELATCLFLVAYTLRRLPLARYGLFRRTATTEAGMRPIARMAPSIAAQAFVEGARWFAFFLILERVGTETLAASNVVYASFAVLMIPSDAFREATYTLIARLLGTRSAEGASGLMRRLVRSAYLASLPLALLAFAFPDAVLSIFSSEAADLDHAATTLRVAAAALLILIPADQWLSALFGAGDTEAALATELTGSAIAIAAAAIAATVLDLSLPFVWLSVPLAGLAALSLSYARVRRVGWRSREV